MPKIYYRPIVQTDTVRTPNAISLAGGSSWFDQCEVLSRGGASTFVSAQNLPDAIRDTLGSAPKPLCGLDLRKPQLMGILNVTPDSFSDGGKYQNFASAVEQAHGLAKDGANIIDIGGESTRPGADFVDANKEIRRTVPVIEAVRAGLDVPISIDTRKAAVAKAAISAGASVFNDVSALSFDPDSLGEAARLNVPVCLMHASGDPKTMQENPRYDDVLLDVYDYLEARRDAALHTGLQPHNIILDPGIGFGKTVAHNLRLLRGLSIFHGLGCPILLGASRKRFIGTLSETQDAANRVSGSVAVALEAIRQGAQIIRVHDVKETRQALSVWEHLHFETE